MTENNRRNYWYSLCKLVQLRILNRKPTSFSSWVVHGMKEGKFVAVTTLKPIARNNDDITENIIMLFPNQISEQNPPKLKKDGTPKNIKCNKVKGRKSEVYPFEIQDIKKIMDYFKENELWLHYLIFVLSCNMARRINDTLSINWENIYNPETGKIRNDLLEITEDKTDKLASPRINSACRAAIELYIEKTGCNPAKDNYTTPVFLQLSGTHKGKVITDDGYRKALKKAAKAVDIEYNIGTHSSRKSFGMLNRMLHPGDYDSMEILQSIYNHSDAKTTKHYIGLTKQKIDKYYDDMGDFFDDYIAGDKEYSSVSEKPIISINSNDLRDVIKAAYEAGRDNSTEEDVLVHIDAINSILGMVEQLAK